MPHTLAGQTALITGGGRGIGRAVAEELARHGVNVVVTARSGREVHDTARALNALGANALGIVADIAMPDDVRKVVEEAVDEFGTIDILVNNAAMLQPVGLAWEVDADEWAYTIHVNLIGVYRLCHAILPLMIEEGAGRIINVSSGAARPTSTTVGWTAYSSSKAALDQFTRILAVEAQPHGISVNAVYPGVTDTRMQADIRGLTPDQFPSVGRFQGFHERGELRDPREPAELVFWLCTSAARDVTGQILDINDLAVRERVARDLGRPLLPGPNA